MRFTKKDLQLIDRHYLKIKLFGYTFRFWNTSPQQVLEHVKELTNHRTCATGCDWPECTKDGCLNTE